MKLSMTRKLACTASIFIVMAVGIAASLLIQVPDDVWWSSSLNLENHVPLLLWEVPNILLPLFALAGGCSGAVALWMISDHLCSELRRSK